LSCDVPVIEHGSVLGGRQQYRENEVLNFKCDPSHKRTDDRQSRCMKVGTGAEWIPTPGCKLIQCVLTPLPGTTYRPPNRNLFLPREKLQVICGDRDYILDHKKTTAQVTCKEDGEWNINPVCLEVKCSNYLPNENLYQNVWTGENNKLGNTVRYSCRRNYRRPDGVTHATCTRDGWTPKPLCQSLSCQKPNLENAKITGGEKWSYKNGDEVTYRCLKGAQTSFTATCDQGTWTGNSGCSGVRPCTKPEIPNGFSVDPINNTLYYSCNEGYKLSTKGWWGET
ncbi:coagulation factor XIII B chain, partial [Austrofundulus limnaeus]|uniref:Coagulation factor XIII B chain n=1 Tax=Austrofundulus limnaeus TaxID=52670 RepID=A0A2I4ALZ9_AUSLI